jgi:hypothetical protein
MLPISQSSRIRRAILRISLRSLSGNLFVWLAAADAPALTSGGFWLDRAPHPAHGLPGTRSTDDEKRQLWTQLKTLTEA